MLSYAVSKKVPASDLKDYFETANNFITMNREQRAALSIPISLPTNPTRLIHRNIFLVMTNKRAIKALGLSSGGLDSILSALILRRAGIEVEWISFKTPFFSPDSAIKASKITGIPLIVKDITDIYMEMLKAPPAGYGKNMNPCMDCHSMMFNQAGSIMRESGYDFLFSGEVAGQRPMSQTKNSMNYVENHSGFKGEILRPLSAKLLPETEMEKKGLVDRELLGSISGRSRKIQMEMAKEFGVTDYPPPAGGCLLTDMNFSKRLKDLMQIQKSYGKRDLYLLKHGRHMRLDEQTKIVVGKSQSDNNKIESMYKPDRDILIRHAFLAGPMVLIPGGGHSRDPEIVSRAGAICAGYTKTKPGERAQILVKSGGDERHITVYTLAPESFQDLMI